MWFASVVIFGATALLPGDAARAVLGLNATPETLAALRERLHLEGSVLEQYWSWTSAVVQLDFGTSLISGQPVGAYVVQLMGNSLVLTAIAGSVALAISIPVGLWFAYKKDTALDHGGSAGTLVLNAMPEFVVAAVLIIVFSTGLLQVLPATSSSSDAHPWADPRRMVLPSATLALALIPYFIRMTRSIAIEILESEYVRYARICGESGSRLLVGHVLPNAMGPLVQVVALQVATLAGGAVIVESIFAYPGLGNGFLNAVLARDIPVIQAISLFIAGVYVLLNICADAGTLLLTPRARVRS